MGGASLRYFTSS